jgi:hypothetical protein
MYSSLQPSFSKSENAVSKRLWTYCDDERESTKRDWLASFAKSGDFPFLAISRMTLEEKSREMVASWLESIAFPTVVMRFTEVRLADSKPTHYYFLPETWPG